MTLHREIRFEDEICADLAAGDRKFKRTFSLPEAPWKCS